jgi:hypothetical protein
MILELEFVIVWEIQEGFLILIWYGYIWKFGFKEDIKMFKEILDEQIYYVCFSDNDSNDHTHYKCCHFDDEDSAKDWCKEVHRKYGGNQIYLKFNGEYLKTFRDFETNRLKEYLNQRHER